MMSPLQSNNYSAETQLRSPRLHRRPAQPKFTVRLAGSSDDIRSALQLRSRVFKNELGCGAGVVDVDRYDAAAHHLLVSDRQGSTIGTYRLNTKETAETADGFYSSAEFTLDNVPSEIFDNGVEIGRACIAKEYRNTKVLFLLWSGLLRFLEESGKRYFFGCCSIFTQDEGHGAAAYHKLVNDGHLHPQYRVMPRRNAVDVAAVCDPEVELPPLFNMYLRLGAKVCGPPMIDREFGTIDFFVLLDVNDVSEKYRRMFSAA